MQEEIKKALEVLNKGGVILQPTDTIAGLSADALNPEAYQKIYQIKNRPTEKKILLLVNNEAMLQNYVNEIPSVAYDLMDFSEKPITIIYPNAINLPEHLIAEDGSIAIRIVKHNFTEQLIQKLRRPLLSTSANTSGKETPVKLQDVEKDILSQVDYVVNLPDNSQSKSSTIIKLELNGEFKIIRK